MDAKQFLAEFGHIINAPGGVQKVKELILFLAINGKMTARKDSDGDARGLYDVVVKHKKRMILEKAIPKQPALDKKDTTDLTSCNRMDWCVCRLIEIIDFQKGKKPSDISSSGKYSYIDVDAFDHNQINSYTDDEECPRCSNNELLIICDGSRSGYIGRSVAGVIGSTLARINNFGLYSLDYLYYLIASYFSFFNKNVKGARIPHLNVAKFRNLVVWLPPIEEQKRIVAKVYELMALCDKLEAQQQKRQQLCQLTRTTALDALATAQSPHKLKQAWLRVQDNLPLFSNSEQSLKDISRAIVKLAVRGLLSARHYEPVNIIEIIQSATELRVKYIKQKWLKRQSALLNVEIDTGFYPKHWVVRPFDNVAVVMGGITKGRNLKDRKVSYFPYLRVANVQRGYFDLDEIKEISIPIDEFDKYELHEGDLLITEGGDWDKVGRTAIWASQINKCLHQNHIFKARISSPLILNEWVELAFNSEVGRDYFAGASKQTTNLASINMTQLRSFPLPIPPITEQKEILYKVNSLLSLCKKIKGLNIRKANLSKTLALASVAAITGTQIKEKEKMKVPKTELVSKLRIVASPTNKEQAPLSAILVKHEGELSAKALWNYSGLEIDRFYQQLKIEMAKGWIVEPEKAFMKEKEAKEAGEN